jgi:murein DD-endopeptidase MepM/ murein hydrolase activator NlpD
MSRITFLVLCTLALTPPAEADEPETSQAAPRGGAAPQAASRATADPDDPRAVAAAAFADQRAVVERTAAIVAEKLAAAAETRAERARDAYKLLLAESDGPAPERGPVGHSYGGSGFAVAGGTDVEPALAIARRRAAARWLLARDRAELWLLAEEASHLLAARQRIERDAARVPTLVLPDAMIWPAQGPIARGFGAFEHDRSGATLTRRGVDLDVARDADVVAPAAGTVRYAGPIRGLDQGVIIDHGDVVTVIGKLAAPLVAAGATVEQGALVGRPARYRVYVEVRFEVGAGGTPVDPASVFPKRAKQPAP